jgi:hypothetical protein
MKKTIISGEEAAWVKATMAAAAKKQARNLPKVGWYRLSEILEAAKQDKYIAEDRGASEFLAIIYEIVNDMSSYGGSTTKEALSILQPFRNSYKKRHKAIAKKSFIKFVKTLYPTLSPKPCRMREWEALDAIKPYKEEHYGAHTLRDWIKEALPGTLKTGRPKKKDNAIT